MSEKVCCVCEKPIAGEVKLIGNRSYDVDCYAKVTRNRGSLWWATLVGIGILVVFVVVAALIFNAVQPQLEGAGLVLVGILLALVPAVIWLAIFYLQDAREPEPKGLVLAIFALGAVFAQGIGMPVVEGVFQASAWLGTSTLHHVLGGILVVGMVEMFLVFAAVRFTVYNSAEFDERADGIVYATAAALGYATVVNINYVVQSGGVDLVSGTLRIAETALAMACFGGLIGFFLGRCKFEDEPLWWMPAGLVLAAVLDGLFLYFRGEVTTTQVTLSGGGYSPWPGLILGAALSLVVFAGLFVLMRRLERRVAA